MPNITKIMLSFVDHENKKIKEIILTLHSGNNIEWEADENDIEGYKQWLLADADFKHKIKQEVDRIVKDKHFPGTSGKDNELLVFNDYVVTKMFDGSESKAVNMNHEKGTPLFRSVKDFNICGYKFSRGEAPKPWTEKFNYDKNIHHHEFLVIGKEGDETVQLKELASFDIPNEKLISYKKESADNKKAANTAAKNNANSAAKNNANAAAKNNAANLVARNNATTRNNSSARLVTATNTDAPAAITNQNVANAIAAQSNNAASINFPSLANQAGGAKKNKYISFY